MTSGEPRSNLPLIGLAGTLDRWFLLRSREAAAAALPADRRARATELHAAGDARIDSAMGERGATALLLARAAIPTHLEAALTARDAEPLPDAVTAGDLWERYDAIAATGALPTLPPTLALGREHAASRQLPEDEIKEYGEARIEEALSLATFLSDAVEVRSPVSIRVERVVRIVAAVTVAVAVLVAARRLAPKPPNLALHTSVTMSSRRPSSGPPLDVTNGKVIPEAGIATNDEPDPWVQLDLAQVLPVSEITLMIGDEHQDDIVPLRAETSIDGNAWEAAGVQRSAFSADSPATITFRSRRARYVRIHGRPNGALYLHEVEVR